MKNYLLTIVLLINLFCIFKLSAQNPTIDISIEQMNAYYNDAEDSIYHEIILDFGIDYDGLPLTDVRQVDLDLKILDQDDINWFLDGTDFGICNDRTTFNVDTTGFSIDSIANIQIQFGNRGVDTSVVCRYRAIATVGILIEVISSNNQRVASDSLINNHCSFRQKADVFIAALDPIITLADQSSFAMPNDTLIRRLWLQTCGLPDLESLQYDTHFEVESYTDSTAVIELMLRYNDEPAIGDSLYYSLGNIRFVFDSLGLANPRFLPCDGCAAYNTNGSAGNSVSINYTWITDYEVETKQRLALIEFDVIQPIDSVCARLIFNKPGDFASTVVTNLGSVSLEPAGFDILIFCPKEYDPQSDFTTD